MGDERWDERCKKAEIYVENTFILQIGKGWEVARR